MIDLQSRVPIYEQVCEGVKNMLLDGELKAGDRLPGVREMAKQLGVNPNTVTKAFRSLEQNKIIYTVPGKGSFAADIVNDKLKNEALLVFDEAAKKAVRAGADISELKDRLEALDNDRA